MPAILPFLLIGCGDKDPHRPEKKPFAKFTKQSRVEKFAESQANLGSTYGLNDFVPCEFTETTGYTFEDDSHYPPGSIVRDEEEGAECYCEIEIADEDVMVTGITAFIARDVYTGTLADDDEEANEDLRPSAVAVYVPWLNSGSMVLDADTEASPDYADIDSWFAFDHNRTHKDDGSPEASVSSGTAIDITGTYEIYVSMVNPNGAELDDCSRLDGTSEDDDFPEGSSPLYFSVDYYEKGYPIAPTVKRYAGGLEENALACASGDTAKTRFMLLDWEGRGYAQAIPVSGERQHTHSEITAVSVVDWNGASSVFLGSEGGVVEFSENAASAFIDDKTQWVGVTEWWSDAETTDGSGPIIEITHSCPDDLTVDTVNSPPSWPVSWSTLDGVLSQVARVEMLDTWSDVEDTDWPVFLVRITTEEDDNFFMHSLQVEGHGQEAIFDLPLVQTEGGYTFSHHNHALSLEGGLSVEDGDLEVSFSNATLNTPLGSVVLDGAKFTLSGYADLDE